MTLNHTRFSESCWRRAFNRYHRRIEGGRGSSFSLADGTAAHAGIAEGLAKKDWELANTAAKTAFDSDVTKMNLLPGEEFVAEDNWELTQAMIKLYRENYETEDIVMVQPEAEFEVPLTNQTHHCVFKHWQKRSTGAQVYRPPTAEEILGHEVTHGDIQHCQGGCHTPHMVCGKIDGIFLWKGQLWIMDHKTTAQYPASWWPQWKLNYQPTIYMYGAMKALGIRPRGFIINAIFRPSDKQVTAWNAKRKSGTLKVVDYLKYEREPFLRSNEDIERARREFVAKADEWEWRIVNGNFPLSPPPQQACFSYNRECEFMPLCTNHDSPDTLEGFSDRGEYDYVEKSLYQIQEAK